MNVIPYMGLAYVSTMSHIPYLCVGEIARAGFKNAMLIKQIPEKPAAYVMHNCPITQLCMEHCRHFSLMSLWEDYN